MTQVINAINAYQRYTSASDNWSIYEVHDMSILRSVWFGR